MGLSKHPCMIHFEGGFFRRVPTPFLEHVQVHISVHLIAQKAQGQCRCYKRCQCQRENFIRAMSSSCRAFVRSVWHSSTSWYDAKWALYGICTALCVLVPLRRCLNHTCDTNSCPFVQGILAFLHSQGHLLNRLPFMDGSSPRT